MNIILPDTGAANGAFLRASVQSMSKTVHCCCLEGQHYALLLGTALRSFCPICGMSRLFSLARDEAELWLF